MRTVIRSLLHSPSRLPSQRPRRSPNRLAVAVAAAVIAVPLCLTSGADAQADPTPPPRNGLIEHTDLAERYAGDFPQYRIPAMATTTRGTVIAAYDGRQGMADLPSDIDVMIRRSTDGGRTWEPPQVVRSARAPKGFGDPSILVDQETGRIFVFYAASINRGYIGSETGNDPNNPNILHPDYSYSDDDGRTWKHRRLTAEMKNPSWGGMFASSGKGIQLRHGEHAGRLIQQYTVRYNGGNYAMSAYSDDHGKTWQTSELVGPGANENKTVELSDGTVMLNSRARPHRLVAYSYDGGQTYTDFQPDTALVDPGNNGSILRYAPEAEPENPKSQWLLFSNTADPDIRRNLTVRMSCDNGQTWPIRRTVEKDSAAYSTLARLPDGDFGLFYERYGYQFMTLARFDVDWLRGTCAPLSVTTEDMVSGQNSTVHVRVTNQNATSLRPSFVTLRVPQGWRSESVRVPRLESGGSTTVDVRVVVPDNLPSRTYELTARLRTGGKRSFSAPHDVRVQGHVRSEQPGLRIEPVLDHLEIGGAPGILDDVAEYWTRFTNTGNVMLTGIEVTGNLSGAGPCRHSSLAPGDSYVCRSTRHTVDADDAHRGSYTPVVDATASTPSGASYSVSAPGEVLDVEQSPAVLATDPPSAEPASSPDAQQPVTVRVPLTNFSSQHQQSEVSLHDLGFWQTDASTQQVDVPAHGTAAATFELSPGGATGWAPVRVDVEVDGEQVTSSVVDIVSGGRHVSDWEWVDQTNGWGPVERDMSNGEQTAGDGRTMSIEDRAYRKGVGVHAPSRIALDLAGRCERFQSDVGVDDEVGNAGSVRFRVVGDGAELWSSSVLTGSSESLLADVDVSGVDELELIVDDGSNGVGQDHADWAGAWLRCAE